MKGLRKNGWKLVLDAVMAVVLALLYNKRVLGIAFHEIAGIGVCGLFIIHKLLNRQWIVAITKGLFSRKTPFRQKLCWVLDFLLLLSFGYVLVSGILISKVVFPTSGGGHAFQAGHYAAAALALALTGVHIGLHLGVISQRMKWLNRLPVLLRRSLAVVLSVAVLVFGGLQLTSTNFTQWIGNLGAVFGAVQTGGNGGEHTPPSGAAGNSTAITGADTATVTDSATLTTALAETATVADSAQETGSGQRARDGQGEHGAGAGNSASIPGVWLSFTALMFAFATLTAWLDGSLAAHRRRKRLNHTLHAMRAT